VIRDQTRLNSPGIFGFTRPADVSIGWLFNKIPAEK